MPETPVTPLRQPPQEDLLNALQIAEMGRDGYLGVAAPQGFADVARLIRAALDKLAEPSPEVIAAARTILYASLADEMPPEFVTRDGPVRDIAAVVLNAALRGVS